MREKFKRVPRNLLAFLEGKKDLVNAFPKKYFSCILFSLMEADLTKKIIGAAIETHRILGGPGLLESIYEEALCHELSLLGLQYQRQLAIPVKYKNIVIRDPLFLDILVENIPLLIEESG